MSTPPSGHVEHLKAFADAHKTGDARVDTLIDMKVAHSLHVYDNAQAIIDREGISGTTAELCLLAAIYHDIGRFPQLARYGTFNDRESINHGRLGVITLRDTPPPGPLSKEDWKIVRIAVGQHNLRAIRQTLPEPFATPARLVRDADKLDIYRVMISHFSGENPDPVITHGFKDIPDRYTPAILQDVMNERTADYKQLRYANDFKILILGWLYDLHFSSSIRILAEREHLDRIISFLPKDERIEALKKKIDIFIHYNNSETLDLIHPTL